ncbi:MAG: hypothetical protein ACRDTE_18520 [Pseudonocardiaceae bacterium]
MAEPRHPPGPTLYWARDRYDGRLHAVALCDVAIAEYRGYTECLCAVRLPADVALVDGPAGWLCLPCVLDAMDTLTDRIDQST